MAEERKETESRRDLSDEEFLEALWESEMGGWRKLQETQSVEAVPHALSVESDTVDAPPENLSTLSTANLATPNVAASLSVSADAPAQVMPAPPYPSLDEMLARMEGEIPTATAAHLADSPFATTNAALKKEVEQHLVFSLAGVRYAIPTTNVMEVGRLPSVTRVPNVPPWVMGVTNRRGDIISVVDLRGFLELEEGNGSPESKRVLFVKTRDEEVVTALVVDQINRIANLEAKKILFDESPPERKLAPFLRGTCEHNETGLAVLDLESLLQSREVRQFESQASLS